MFKSNFSVLSTIAILILSAGLINCSSGGSGGPAKPAAPAEYSKRVTHTLATAQKLIELKQGELKNGSTGRSIPHQIISLALTNLAENNSAAAGSPDNGTVHVYDADASARKIEQKVSTQDCEFHIPIDEDPNANGKPSSGGLTVSEIPSIHAWIRGPQCPINMTMDTDSTKDANGVTATFKLHLVAVREDLRQELGAKEITMTGDIRMHFQQAGENININGNGQMTISGILIDDKTFGTKISYGVEMAMKMPQQPQGQIANPPFLGSGTQAGTNSSSGGLGGGLGDGLGDALGSLLQMKMKVVMNQTHDFGDTATQLGMSVAMEGFKNVTEKYVVNGRDVSREEFAQYASSVNLPGIPQTGDQSGGGVSTPGGPDSPHVRCELRVYSQSRIAFDELVKMNGENRLPALSDKSIVSCDQRMTATLPVPETNDVLQMSIQPFPDFTMAQVSSQSSGPDMSQLIIQKEDHQSLVAQFGRFSYVFMCQPVVQCP